MLKLHSQLQILELGSGKPYDMGPNTPMPLGQVFLLVLDSPLESPTPGDLVKRLGLRAKVARALKDKGTMEFNAEAVVLLKDLVAKGIQPVGLAASVVSILDGQTEIEGLPLFTAPEEDQC